MTNIPEYFDVYMLSVGSATVSMLATISKHCLKLFLGKMLRQLIYSLLFQAQM